jgi:FMN-dependent NADH-azoreductase
MPTLPHIDASPRSDRSVSRQLTEEFAVAWKQSNPGGQIIYRDLERGKVGRDEYLRPIREQVRLKGRGGLAALKS